MAGNSARGKAGLDGERARKPCRWGHDKKEVGFPDSPLARKKAAAVLGAFIIAYAAFAAWHLAGGLFALAWGGNSGAFFGGIGSGFLGRALVPASFGIFSLLAVAYSCREHGGEGGAMALAFMLAMALMDSAGFFLLDLLIVCVFAAIPFYVYLQEGAGIKRALEGLGLSAKGGLPRIIGWGIAGAACMMAISLAVSVLLFFLGISDQQRVAEKLSEFPLQLLFAAVFLSPVSEEILFRGFLSRRFGIPASSIVFALSHALYGSVAEVAAAFFLGAYLCVLARRAGSLYPAIIAHSLFNLATVIYVVFL